MLLLGKWMRLCEWEFHKEVSKKKNKKIEIESIFHFDRSIGWFCFFLSLVCIFGCVWPASTDLDGDRRQDNSGTMPPNRTIVTKLNAFHNRLKLFIFFSSSSYAIIWNEQTVQFLIWVLTNDAASYRYTLIVVEVIFFFYHV